MSFEEDGYKIFLKQLKKNAKVCIFGADITAKKIKEKIQELRPDVKIQFFINSFKEGEFENLPLYNLRSLKKHIKEVDVGIVASIANRNFMKAVFENFGLKEISVISKNMIIVNHKHDSDEKLLNEQREAKNILETPEDREIYQTLINLRYDSDELWKVKKFVSEQETYCNNIYLDYINKEAIKTVISGGAYDGYNSIIFNSEFKNIEKIYGFEPIYDKVKEDLYDEIIKDIEKIEIIKKGLWNKSGVLEFREELEQPFISTIKEARGGTNNSKNMEIETISIDEFAKEKGIKVDFIKMDIENAELEALKGAEEILKKDRPQLAICIYHSIEHYSGIILYLNKVLTDYIFRIGHYSWSCADTVLYAIPKELYKKG